MCVRVQAQVLLSCEQNGSFIFIFFPIHSCMHNNIKYRSARYIRPALLCTPICFGKIYFRTETAGDGYNVIIIFVYDVSDTTRYLGH